MIYFWYLFSIETTKIYREYQVKGELPFPEAIVLGDSAYKRSWDWLMTPFLEGLVVDDPKRKIFNKCICGTRSCIECVFGQIKRKFYCLDAGVRFTDMKKSSKIIKILSAIHNYVRRQEPLDLYFEYLSEETLALYSEDYVFVDDCENMPTNERFFRKYFS